MEVLFTKQYYVLWSIVLALALFLPVRKLVWVLYVRRAQAKAEIDEAERRRLRQRAGISAALICFVFAFLYVGTLFKG